MKHSLLDADSPEHTLVLAKIIAAITALPEWQVFEAELRNSQRQIGELALHNDEHSRDWWQGYHAGFGQLMTDIRDLKRAGAELVDTDERLRDDLAAGGRDGAVLAFGGDD